MNTVFVGRKRELESLKSLLNRNIASLVVVKGRRRIGKSRLIEEFAKDSSCFLSFTGVPPSQGVTAEDQKKEFVRQLKLQAGLPGIESKDWGDLFAILANQVTDKQAIVLLDEISWMAHKDPTFLGKLKIAWDTLFSKNSQLILILCGSVSSWIEKNIISSTGFFGRITLKINVPELSLTESNELLAAQGFVGSAMEKFMILSITGGVPRYIELIDKNKSAESNIKALCFESSSILVEEFENIFNDLFCTGTDVYKKIVQALADGALEYLEISKAIKYDSGGALSEYINSLVACGFISKDVSWSIKLGNDIDLNKYRLSDNYLRFYLKYVHPNLSKIKKRQFENISLSALPGWTSIIGLQFENLVLNNRTLIWQALGINAEEIIADNPYFQRKTKKHKGCQIDYLVQTRYNTLFACEIKFSKNELDLDLMTLMQNKLQALALPKRYSCFPVLIHVNGISENLEDKNYFVKTIDFKKFIKTEICKR